MQAAWFEQFGPAGDVLAVGDFPKPEAGEGEVLIRLRTSGVNPSDVKKRAGSFPDLLAGGAVIPHSDGAGIIESVGAGVDESRIGQRVWTYQAQFARRLGTAAQYVAIDQSRAVPLPDQTDFVSGACLGIPAMTAHRCVFGDGPVEGKSLLVTGGAGRVGFYAIQWAVRAGAKVVATASNDEDAECCRRLGALEVVNHRIPGWGDMAHEAIAGEGFDRVVEVEFGANLEEVLSCIKVGGVVSTYSSTQVTEPALPFFRMMYMDLTLHLVIVYAMPEQAKEDAIRDITRSLEHGSLGHGSLEHRVAARYPLADIAEAHRAVENGATRGCVIVDID